MVAMFRPPKEVEEEKPASNPNEEVKEEERPTEMKGGVTLTRGRLTATDVVTAQQTVRDNMTVKDEREDLISLGGVASPNGAGVQIIAGESGQRIKISDAGYDGAEEGLHYFYFGTSTTPTTKRLLSCNRAACVHQTFKNPRIGAEGDGLYLYSSVAESNMPYDVGYVQE